MTPQSEELLKELINKEADCINSNMEFIYGRFEKLMQLATELELTEITDELKLIR